VSINRERSEGKGAKGKGQGTMGKGARDEKE